MSELAELLPVGSRLFVIVRARRYTTTLRIGQARIIDLRSERAPADTTLGPDVAAVLGYPYLYSRGGIALQGSQTAEQLVTALARILHGDPSALTVIAL